MKHTYSPKQFSKMIGVSVFTLQRWDRQGMLKAHRSLTNRRYYTHDQYLQYRGLVSSEQGKVIAYARVSSPSQKKDLATQKEALRAYSSLLKASSMLLTTLFSLPADLCLAEVSLENEGLTPVVKSSQASAVCPACMQPSTHIRGRYTRTLADLPCQGRAVRARLEVRRFMCRIRGCPHTTFAERFPMLTRAYARRMLRQAESLTEIAFAQGGIAGE